MNRECTAAIPKPRKRRAESNVAEDTLSVMQPPGLLNGAATIGPQETPRAPPVQPPIFDPGVAMSSLLSRSDIRHKNSRSFTTLLAQGSKLDTGYIVRLTSPSMLHLGCLLLALVVVDTDRSLHEQTQGELLKGVDANFVQTSFTVFRQFTTYFPFVYLHPGDDPVSMAAHRPFMTIAICTITSAAYPEMQDRLRQAVRLSLSAKAIVEGECSVDLLLGLLIFLAWHHHSPGKQQIYQYLCLLAGMATDLGIYPHDVQYSQEHIASTIERAQAFLGCYYICSSLSRKGFGNHNPLRWTDTLRQHVENADTHNSPSNAVLASLVELARTLEHFLRHLRG